MEFKFTIAGIHFKLTSEHAFPVHPYLREFENKENDEIAITYQIKICKSLPTFEIQPIYHDAFQKIYIEEQNEIRLMCLPLLNKEHLVYYEKDNIIYVKEELIPIIYKENNFSLLNALALEKKMINKNAFILHSSFIIYDDIAILFTAPSGTGKSTQASLWEKYGNATIVNGDKTLIKKEDNIWYAYGFPVCGSSQICLNKRAKIKAIIYLQQGNENSCTSLPKSESIKKIISETSINFWNKHFLDKAIHLITDFCIEIPMYKYVCTKKEDAYHYLKQFLEV